MYLKTDISNLHKNSKKIIKKLMILISHRGNIDKINTKEENKPTYTIFQCLRAEF